MTTEVQRVVADAVMDELTAQGRTVGWLAEASQIDELALAAMLSRRRDFTVTDLAGIADALGVEIRRLLPVAPRQPSAAPGE